MISSLVRRGVSIIKVVGIICIDLFFFCIKMFLNFLLSLMPPIIFALSLPDSYDSSVEYPIVDHVREAGYPIEIHTVITDDGYILNVHRIKHGKDNGYNSGNEVVFLMHGLQTSGYSYVICTENLAFLLADNGYDVWIGNSRGSRYSSEHVKYNSSDLKSEYWDFSFHEIGVHDLPKTINYIIETTEKENIFYVGHSQGTTDFFAMASERPEMNSRIRLMIAMSPILNLKNLQHRGIKWAATNIMTIRNIISSLGLHGIIIPGKEVNSFANLICKNQTFVPICKFFLMQNDYNYDTFVKNSQLPAEDVIRLILEGVSAKQLYHLGQLIRSGIFRQFNYGEIENLKHYHAKDPPLYDVRKITVPLALYYAYSDVFTSAKDIAVNKRILPNVVYDRRIDIKDFNHLDFIVRKNITEILYKDILKLLNTYSRDSYI